MNGISLRFISKMGTIAFLFYVLWFRYPYGESAMLLYGTAGIAIGCAVLDLFLTRADIQGLFPFGVLTNLIMCVYSLATGVLVATNLNMLISEVKTYFAFSSMCVVIGYICIQESSMDWLIDTLIAIGLVTCFYVGFRGYYFPGYGYVLSPDNNPNVLGVTLVMGLFALAYRGKPNTKHIFYAIPSAVLMIYFIIGCSSRKSLIAAGLICVLWAWPVVMQVWKKGNKVSKALMIVIVLAIAAGVWYYFTNVYIESESYARMQNLGDSSEGSSSHRMLYHKFAVDYMLDSPLFGIGLHHFITRNPYHQMSHSTYAESLASWGLVGCAIYFFPIVQAAFRAFGMAFGRNSNYVDRIILALVITELFLGIGQVFFYEISHMTLWTLIFVYQSFRQEKPIKIERKYKYVKT